MTLSLADICAAELMQTETPVSVFPNAQMQMNILLHMHLDGEIIKGGGICLQLQSVHLNQNKDLEMLLQTNL